MNQESVDVITRDRFSKLLQGPGCSRMGRDIAVQNAATSHFHHHQHVQHSEASRDGYQEVSGHDGLGVIVDKRPPVLRSCSPTASWIPLLRPVRPHRSGRNQDSELHRTFGCGALLAQVGFSCTMRTISWRRFSGIRGLPNRDFRRQNILNPLRCQPIRVSGLTIISAALQWNT